METAARRILVVDDNQNAADMVVLLLQHAGAYRGIGSRRSHCSPARCRAADDVVLLDIGLPGSDGYEVARLLRQANDSAVRIVALTGRDKETFEAMPGIEYFDAMLEKPASMKSLQALLA